MNPIPIERGDRCEKTIEFLVRAKRDQDKHTHLNDDLAHEDLLQRYRTNSKVITTRQSEQILY